ncbi:MAG: hypothetical protein CHACPFDD_03168 [Phycisphaerae bacterium]|nr:hypothetical protein [Phycisphaerae bacterium]
MTARRRNAESRQNRACHLRVHEESGQPAGPRRRPLSAAWITDELLAETRRVWSRHLRRDVHDEEAIEMLINVRNAAMAILGIGVDE